MTDLFELSYGPNIRISLQADYQPSSTWYVPNWISTKNLARGIVRMTRLLLKQNYLQFRQNIYTLDYFRYVDDILIAYMMETEQDSK
jgi:hypothetical protein